MKQNSTKSSRERGKDDYPNSFSHNITVNHTEHRQDILGDMEMILAFKLSMPNVGSWNGKWSGEEELYVKTVNLGNSKKATIKAQNLLTHKDNSGYFYYNFGDGWGAGVTVYPVNAKEAAKLRKKSKGFCGYDWMIDSIISDGKIIAPSSRNN